jgi:tRNA-dihydrouridine synthase
MVQDLNRPFKFKSGLKLPNMVFPGPMDGVMSRLFCKAAEDMDLIDFWMTPFIRMTTGPVGKSKILSFTDKFSSRGKPVIVQLMGTNPDYLIKTAFRCRELGFAGVNFNLACPSKVVLGKGSGGALLKNHTFIKQLMEASLELGKDFSISLKIRTGFDSPDEIEEIAKSAKGGDSDSILDFVVVHHRTVSEGYAKVSGRIERIAKAVKHFDGIPIIANGDIDSYRDAERVLNETGSVGVMIARQWLKSPFVIRNILASENSTDQEKAKEFLAELIHNMAVNSQNNPGKGDRHAIIDMASYIVDRNHPLFEYLIHAPFREPAIELSKDIILEMLN